MSDFPTLTCKRLIKVLGAFDSQVVRIKGSHHFLRHRDGRCTVIPVHHGEAIGSGLFGRILRDCELSREELRAAL
ncbi:MAG: type II toxin-antitoxin system HicA family toxin [Bacteroidia bacterium]|nr:type II toxin-antitoxin system HicA family toxin [Bacteroidia bacterium]